MKKRLFSIVLAAVTCLAVIASVLNLGAVESGAAQMSQTESKRPETLSGANTAESDALSRANAALIEAAINEARAETASEKATLGRQSQRLVSGQSDILGHFEVFDQPDTATGQLEALFTTIDLMDATISDLQDEMTAGNLTAEQLTQMYIDRINAYDENKKLNSVISINPSALNDAKALDQERSEGKIRGPLHGIPIIVKANYDVAGMATSAGSNALARMIAPEDSFTVKKLKEAGAVIIGQANMSEFAFSAADSASTLGGAVHNPYDLSKTPAGSSGGSAVAVTSNFAAAGLGTDTGGSIRNPSSFCNLYGIRPSKGLTSISGVFPLEASRDTTGPMARTAEDMALLLQTIAGTDQADDFTMEADADILLGDGYMDSLSADGLQGMRIGYLANSFYYDYTRYDNEEPVNEVEMPNPKITAMMRKSLANMVKAGAEFVDISEDVTLEMLQKYYQGASEDTMEYDTNKYLHEKGDAAPYKTLKELTLTGNGIMTSYLEFPTEEMADSFETTKNVYTETINGFLRLPSWKISLEGREEISQILKKNDLDAVIYLAYYDAPPSLPITYDNWKATGTSYPYVFGPALGLPEISLPMGFSDAPNDYTSEMPLGFSLFTEFGNDETLMKIAYAYEQQAGSFIRRMPASSPALEDKSLNAFLIDLMDKAYSIDYSKYKIRPEARIQQLRTVLNKAKNADLRDPYAAYEAASALALAYDQLMDSLQGAGTGALKTDLTTCKVELSKTEYYYNGKSRKPNVTVKDGKTILSAGTDYYTIYQNNTDAGTAKVIVRGAGDYMGTVTKTFKILPKEVEPEVNLSKASYTWDGKVKTPDVKVKTEEESLTKEDYTVEYSSGRKAVGTYKVAVKLKNNYSGKKTVSFTINPNGTTISKADPAKNGFTVKWKKQTQQTTGYQIQYSTSSGFKSGNKTVTVTPNTATSKKITKLKAKTKYYVRVRTYKTISGKKYYSGWSKAVAVKTK